MELIVNGERHAVAQQVTVQEFLDSVGLDARKVAVERNREIVTRSAYGQTLLDEGDRIEIVHFIGGG
ncbi:sulfur carrier protein ThiS [Haematospirillum jordaniae]|uniref:Thiamine biosynthesis protein ThiS n=1 Tax=Haematospirillum jordaniae TaxID=1549855 RepID=A0A143DF91_9PROT|nr:thiamine biosynthesis protein ThiS [Haematospirillum jordaniae]NKD56258.1 sulfur carrier protein ThiS [Haematospirillum jordaniae]NKD58315.1 sulfur carrier protein ThiS [Haematospirillum jordaniae]NKD78318.1 sulfur carrier protein ThiS [Haematospirillum jordaniae]NKD80382.1 sulfur carrier protein ThiS [Haematospirillum jordaniae]